MLRSALHVVSQASGAEHRGGSVDLVSRHSCKPGSLASLRATSFARLPVNHDHEPQPRLMTPQRHNCSVQRRLVAVPMSRRQTQWDGEGEGAQRKIWYGCLVKTYSAAGNGACRMFKHAQAAALRCRTAVARTARV